MSHSARVALFAIIVVAAGYASAADPQTPLKTVTYDFSDLIEPNRPDDQPDPTPKTLTADQPIGPNSITRSESRESLVSLVKETVDPSSWQPSGPATLTVDGDKFVISQTADNHRGVASILQQLRPSPSTKLYNRFHSAPRLPANTRFDKTELADAVAAISKAVDVPIFVDYKSLAKFNVQFDTPVTADVSGQIPPRALRTVIRAAANLDLPLKIDAAPTSVTINLERPPRDPNESASRVYDLRHLPARASGLDPKQPHPRQAVIDALVQRVRKECNPNAIREVGAHLIVTAPHKTLDHVARYLEELDTLTPPAKP